MIGIGSALEIRLRQLHAGKSILSPLANKGRYARTSLSDTLHERYRLLLVIRFTGYRSGVVVSGHRLASHLSHEQDSNYYCINYSFYNFHT